MNNIKLIALTAITLSSSTITFLSCDNFTTNSCYIRDFDSNDIDKTNINSLDSNFDFNIYNKNLTNSSFYSCINSPTCAYTEFEVENMSNEKKENFNKLAYFETLKDDWDEFGSFAPKKAIIAIAHKWIKHLEIQPEIFPTPDGGIQFEYAIGKNQHLNIEIFSEKKIKIFQMFSDRTYVEDIFELNFDIIKRRIDKFYGTI